MRAEKLFETMADINENYVDAAHKKKDKKHFWIRWIAAVAAACLCIIVILHFGNAGDDTLSTQAKELGM